VVHRAPSCLLRRRRDHCLPLDGCARSTVCHRAAALGLLLIGIHNAWDTVTHIVLTESEGDGQTSDAGTQDGDYKNRRTAISQKPSRVFTGSVRIDAPFQRNAPARIGGAIVTFESGARTARHTHPSGRS
jgi:hypothetical protein